jgi:hypothetical protein
MSSKQLEASILEAAHNNDDRLDLLLDEAEEAMGEDQLELLLDKILQSLKEDYQDLRGWK